MQSITSLALLAGIAFVVPAYADLEWNNAEPIKMADESSQWEGGRHATDDSLSKNESDDPKFEALKNHVNAALEAHKDKVPKELQGHHQEMKAYVGRALDGQKLAQQKLKDAKNLKEAVLDLVDHSTMPRNVKSSVPMCIKQEIVDETCLGGIIRWQGGNLWRTLYTQCDGTHLWIHWHGACENKYVKQACEAMARLAHIDLSYVQSCLDTPVTN